jgi:flagellar hook-associated protein 3 FlgL
MDGMRITQRMTASRTLAGLEANQNALTRLQQEVSSGKVITRPSDDPAGTVSALQLRGEISRQDQWARNANDGVGWLGTLDTALTSANSTLRRVRDLVVQGLSSGTNSAQSLQALATEVSSLKDTLIADANTNYLGRPVFGGTTAATAAYSSSGTFQGDSVAVSRTIGAGNNVRVDVDGRDAFGDDSTGNDVFTLLSNIASNLTSGNTAALGSNLTSLDKHSSNIVTKLADVGTRYGRVEQARINSDSKQLDLKSSLSGIEDVDLPKTLMNISLQQAAYQAALKSTASIVQPSLVDFLR